MRIVPTTLRTARAFIEEIHRHSQPPRGWICGVALEHEGGVIGVGVLGRPVSRVLQQSGAVEITRVCVEEGHPNANSMIYGSLSRVAEGLGYQRVITYTHVEESGSSLKAAGFIPAATVKGREWSCPSRNRKASHDTADKVRWERALRPRGL